MISEAQTECNHRNEHYVLDGGSLLHRIPWTKGDSYGEIAESYADFTIRHYGLATVVFDGYTRGPSIKDNTHERRTRHKVCPVVIFTAETKFVGKKEDFLSRPTNKQNIIDMISVKMQKKGCHVINSLGDADADIAKVAVKAAHYGVTTVIGEDTDLLVLLLFYANADIKDLYFRSDKPSCAKIAYHINSLQARLGKNTCCQLLFVHAFTGCDSTSPIFGVGKKTAFEKIINGHSVMISYSKPRKRTYSKDWNPGNGCTFWWQRWRVIDNYAISHFNQKNSFIKCVCCSRTFTPYSIVYQISLFQSLLPNNGMDGKGERDERNELGLDVSKQQSEASDDR